MSAISKLLTAQLFLLLFIHTAKAQHKTIHGVVVDKQSDEPIPFASAQLRINHNGVLTDSAGKFLLNIETWPTGDTLEVSSVGYKNVLLPLSAIKDSVFFTVKIEVLPPQHEVVVKSKYNRALWFWRKIVASKEKHEKSYWKNFSYEIYNKLELDINNVNRNKLSKNKLIKPLNFVFNYIDSTTENKPFLPVYLVETLSDFYLQREPYRTREVIRASRTDGIENESIIKQLGNTYQNVNIYANFLPVFNKQFVSPFNDNGDNYYNFKLLDTQYLSSKRLVHLRFVPKRKGENTFEGDCWVHDTSFAVQKITMRPSGEANINFISGLSFIQEFRLINDTTWFLYKDKFVADIAPIGKDKLGFKGRKTTSYNNVILNDSSVLTELDKSKKAEDIVLVPNTNNLPDSFWLNNRPEALNKNEKAIYAMLDTLEKNPTYKRYRSAIFILATGVKDVGNIRIGPWFYWVSGNSWEGTRLRFDVATNRKFNNNLYLHTYLAYGFSDQQFKGKAEIKYLLNRTPWSYLLLSYKNDLDHGQTYYDQIGTDNLFAFRRPGIPVKFQKIEEKKFEYYKENNSGIHYGFSASGRQFTPLKNLPGKELFPTKTGDALNSFETSVRLRYAYLERIVEDNFYRTSLGSDYPIVELIYTHGWQGVFNSSYQYNKLNLSVSDYLKIPPYGTLYYNFFAGKIFGNLPYQLLEIHPGNEMYYYNKYAFNLMNRYEYISDQFAGFNIEHNIGNGLFRYIPITRKLKFRQFWSAKGVTGNLSTANKQINFVGNYPFHSLDNKLYLELGTGVDNILKFFRVDFVWRVAPPSVPQQSARDFGIFGSFRLSF